jgi:nitrogenase molybdenum-iron protein alpha/beta subunit
LGDAAQYNPGASYYIKALRMIEEKGEVDAVYVSSDSPDHEIVQMIKQAHPNVKILNMNEEYTIKYGIVLCRVILSHGTYSSIIGYLSDEVYYPEEKKKWYGELSRENWVVVRV